MWSSSSVSELGQSFILAYTAWSYYVFRGKVKAGEGYH